MDLNFARKWSSWRVNRWQTLSRTGGRDLIMQKTIYRTLTSEVVIVAIFICTGILKKKMAELFSLQVFLSSDWMNFKSLWPRWTLEIRCSSSICARLEYRTFFYQVIVYALIHPNHYVESFLKRVFRVHIWRLNGNGLYFISDH